MRLFTGLDLPADVAANLERVQARLRPRARIHWSPVANLHVTTRFIGEWPEERLGELRNALAAIPGRDPIRVAVRRLGFFPNERAPRVFWCGVEAPGLRELAEATETACTTVGIPREQREYSAHLTLARIKERGNFQPLRDAIAELDSLEFGGFAADRFYLYHSRLTPSGSVYTKLAELPFATK